MKRRITVVLLVAMMLMASASVLFSCQLNRVDRYDGTISATGYATADEAAEAYLDEEFSGETETLIFESYEKKQDLTRDQIERLPLGSYKASAVEKAEKGEVKYVEMGKTRATDSAETEVKVKAVVLVLLDGKYHHCTLAAKTGEKISKSYYDSVIDLSQFNSYVYEVEGTITGQSTDSSELKLNQSVKQKMIYTKDAIYLEMKTTVDESTSEINSIEIVSYFLPKNDSSLWMFIKYNFNGQESENWISQTMSGNMNEYSNDIIASMDQTYFIKTNDGFKLDETKYAQYLNSLYGELFDSLMANVEVKVNKASATYHVKNGHISTAEGAFDLTLTNDGQTVKLLANNTIKLSGLNSTTLTVPQDVLDLAK